MAKVPDWVMHNVGCVCPECVAYTKQVEREKSDDVWSGIRIRYPPNDPNGQYYMTKFRERKENRDSSGLVSVAVTMDLIPAGSFCFKSPTGWHSIKRAPVSADEIAAWKKEHGLPENVGLYPLPDELRNKPGDFECIYCHQALW